MEGCIFCRIIKREIPSQIVCEDDLVLAFNDVNPGAPVHVLIVPKKHIPGVNALTDEDRDLVGRIVLVAQKLARERSIAEDGYRVVVNQGANAGQSVGHLHFHLLGGRPMSWPPG
jgi:histidine triad (HIT) family protein